MKKRDLRCSYVKITKSAFQNSLFENNKRYIQTAPFLTVLPYKNGACPGPKKVPGHKMIYYSSWIILKNERNYSVYFGSNMVKIKMDIG